MSLKIIQNAILLCNIKKKELLRILLTFLLLMCLINQNNAQSNILMYNNLKYETPDSVLNFRTHTLKQLMRNDTVKIKNRVIDNFSALYLSEYLLLLFWNQEYENVLEEISRLDAIEMNKYYQLDKPQIDELTDFIFEKSIDRKSIFESGIEKSGINEEEKALLMLILRYLMSEGVSFIEINQDSTNNKNELIYFSLHRTEQDRNIIDTPIISQDSINKLSDNYLQKFPRSKYSEFIKHNVRYKYTLSNWKISSQLFAGWLINTGKLAEYYNNSFVVGLGVDINYNRFFTYVQVFRGFGKTEKDIPFDTQVWNSNSNTSSFMPEITLGYTIIDNKTFRLSGTGGIASTILGPTSSDKKSNSNIEAVKLGYSLTYTLGGFINIKFSNFMKHNYSFVRIRYNYCKPKFPDEFSGNFHNITIGIGVSGRKAKREF